ncbi:MAG: energy-coupling factor transporter transmembrane component T [Actinomycetota bacterium]|nr:energy-coupling factor transporter transmembrane component T [Actinomycetota bacterium]
MKRVNKNLILSLHPTSQLLLAMVFVLLSLMSENPFLQISIIASVGGIAFLSGKQKELASWWKLCLGMGLIAFIINPLFSREGTTILLSGPFLPVLGKFDVTMEATAFGATMGLRIAAVILSFALLWLILDPVEALGALRKSGFKSGLTSALALRLVPTVARDSAEILDAHRARGIAKDKCGKMEYLKSRIPLLKRLVYTSLDRAMGLAEAIESRAYGSSGKTKGARRKFLPWDIFVISFSSLALIGGILGAKYGVMEFKFYPSISFMGTQSIVSAIALPALLLLSMWVLSCLWTETKS